MSDTDAKRARRMTYIRWRLREGKEVTEEQRKELNEYDAEQHGAYAEVLDRLSFEDISSLKRIKADKLTELAKDAALVEEEEVNSVTKKEVVSRIKTFRELGLLGAKRAIAA